MPVRSPAEDESPSSQQRAGQETGPEASLPAGLRIGDRSENQPTDEEQGSRQAQRYGRPDAEDIDGQADQDGRAAKRAAGHAPHR